MKSIGRFNYPTDGRRVMAVLIPNPEKKTCDAMVVDPEKIGLAKVKRTRRMVFSQPHLRGALAFQVALIDIIWNLEAAPDVAWWID